MSPLPSLRRFARKLASALWAEATQSKTPTRRSRRGQLGVALRSPTLRSPTLRHAVLLSATFLPAALLTPGCVMLTGDFELLEQECAEAYSCSNDGELRSCTRLDGDELLTPVEHCGASHLCDSANGRCLTCVPRSQPRCNEDVLEHCNADGTGWEMAEDCAADGLYCAEDALDDGVVARCVPCREGERVCNDAQDAVLECTRTNQGWEFHEERACPQFGCLEGDTEQGLRDAWCQTCTEPKGRYCVVESDGSSDTLQICSEDLFLTSLECNSGEECVTLPNGSGACVAKDE